MTLKPDTETFLKAQHISGFQTVAKTINVCPNHGKRILVGNRKRSQMKCGRTRV